MSDPAYTYYEDVVHNGEERIQVYDMRAYGGEEKKSHILERDLMDQEKREIITKQYGTSLKKSLNPKTIESRLHGLVDDTMRQEKEKKEMVSQNSRAQPSSKKSPPDLIWQDTSIPEKGDRPILSSKDLIKTNLSANSSQRAEDTFAKTRSGRDRMHPSLFSIKGGSTISDHYPLQTEIGIDSTNKRDAIKTEHKTVQASVQERGCEGDVSNASGKKARMNGSIQDTRQKTKPYTTQASHGRQRTGQNSQKDSPQEGYVRKEESRSSRSHTIRDTVRKIGHDTDSDTLVRHHSQTTRNRSEEHKGADMQKKETETARLYSGRAALSSQQKRTKEPTKTGASQSEGHYRRIPSEKASVLYSYGAVLEDGFVPVRFLTGTGHNMPLKDVFRSLLPGDWSVVSAADSRTLPVRADSASDNPLARRITFSFRNMPLLAALDAIGKEAHLSFGIYTGKKTITISEEKKKPYMLFAEHTEPLVGKRSVPEEDAQYGRGQSAEDASFRENKRNAYFRKRTIYVQDAAEDSSQTNNRDGERVEKGGVPYHTSHKKNKSHDYHEDSSDTASVTKESVKAQSTKATGERPSSPIAQPSTNLRTSVPESSPIPGVNSSTRTASSQSSNAGAASSAKMKVRSPESSPVFMAKSSDRTPSPGADTLTQGVSSNSDQTESSYTLHPGRFSEQIRSWCARENYTLVYNAKTDLFFEEHVHHDFGSDLETALSSVFRILRDQGCMLRGVLYVKERTVLVEGE